MKTAKATTAIRLRRLSAAPVAPATAETPHTWDFCAVALLPGYPHTTT